EAVARRNVVGPPARLRDHLRERLFRAEADHAVAAVREVLEQSHADTDQAAVAAREHDQERRRTRRCGLREHQGYRGVRDFDFLPAPRDGAGLYGIRGATDGADERQDRGDRANRADADGAERGHGTFTLRIAASDREQTGWRGERAGRVDTPAVAAQDDPAFAVRPCDGLPRRNRHVVVAQTKTPAATPADFEKGEQFPRTAAPSRGSCSAPIAKRAAGNLRIERPFVRSPLVHSTDRTLIAKCSFFPASGWFKSGAILS